jgi:hypothetical protein
MSTCITLKTREMLPVHNAIMNETNENSDWFVEVSFSASRFCLCQCNSNAEEKLIDIDSPITPKKAAIANAPPNRGADADKPVGIFIGFIHPINLFKLSNFTTTFNIKYIFEFKWFQLKSVIFYINI